MKNLIDIINEKLVLSKTKYKHPKDEYFYHESLENGYTTKFVDTGNVLYYSIDNCKTWNELKPKTESPEISKGERIYFKGENMKIGENYGIGQFESNKKFNAGGNIMSLIYGDDFNDKLEILKDKQFIYLFYKNINLISAKDLVLPATKLTNSCYRFMFGECTSLTKAPELPATKLAQLCYSCMFGGCEALIEAPELPATELADACYYFMFAHCTSLNKITMLATDISVDYCLYGFVRNVSGTGTFIKVKGVDIEFSEDGIPEGWNVKEI